MTEEKFKAWKKKKEIPNNEICIGFILVFVCGLIWGYYLL